MYLTDSHIHLQDYTTADIKNVVTEAQKNNICAFVCSSSSPNDWNDVLNLAQQYSQIVPSLGIHPWCAGRADFSNLLLQLEGLLETDSRIWIGECGIDRLKPPDLKLQSAVFIPQMELAQKYERPLTVHAVKANDILAGFWNKLPQKTLFHSFTGSAEWGMEIQRYGFYLGINFSLLRKKNYPDLLNALDLNLLLVETDGPYQSGEKNKPSLPSRLPFLVEKIATARNIAYHKVLDILYRNWLNFKGEKNYAEHT